jgi:CheY-like chemotaxis protein
MSLPPDSLRRIAELLHDIVPELDGMRDRADAALERMGEGRMPETEVRELRRSAEDTSAILRDTLNLLTGWSAPSTQRFHAGEVAETLLSAMSLALARIELTVRLDVGERAQLAGVASWYRRALGNLLRNAALHARRRVALSVREQPDAQGRAGVLVAVEDDGAGWSPAPERAGYGIGLESAAWAASLLGGRLSRGTSAELGGARVELWFPVAGADVPAARVSAAAILENVRVAVADDEESVRRLLSRSLGGLGARVTAFAPDVPMDELLAAEPDVLLLDLNLGITTGEWFWLALQKRSPQLARRTIFLTGAANPELSRPAVRQPVVAKPFGLVELTDAIRSMAQTPADGPLPVIGLAGLDPDAMEIYGTVLNQYSWTVQPLAFDALHTAPSELDSFDAILLGIGRHAAQALVFVQRLRADPLRTPCPVLVIATDPTAPGIAELRMHGAEILVPPVSPHELARRVQLGFGTTARRAH